jgi:hypothetical protein
MAPAKTKALPSSI